MEDSGVRQPHVRPRPARLKMSETEHRTPWNSAQKIELSKADETLHRQPSPSNEPEGSPTSGYERRRQLFAFVIIAAFALVLMVGLILLSNSDGGNSSVSTNSTTSTNSSAGVNREKQLYYDMAVAEDRGDMEALKRAGGCASDSWNMDVAMYSTLSKQLMARYGNQVLAKYGVSRAQWSEIMLKGATERWETPDPPTC